MTARRCLRLFVAFYLHFPCRLAGWLSRANPLFHIQYSCWVRIPYFRLLFTHMLTCLPSHLLSSSSSLCCVSTHSFVCVCSSLWQLIELVSFSSGHHAIFICVPDIPTWVADTATVISVNVGIIAVSKEKISRCGTYLYTYCCYFLVLGIQRNSDFVRRTHFSYYSYSTSHLTLTSSPKGR